MRHEIVNVVEPVIATVEAPPERDFCEKLPSGLVSVQLVTPCVVQKIDVREPSGTVAGAAQIRTFGATLGTEEVATVVFGIV